MHVNSITLCQISFIFKHFLLDLHTEKILETRVKQNSRYSEVEFSFS